MNLLDSYVVLGGATFLTTHSPAVTEVFQRLTGEVSSVGANYLTQVTEGEGWVSASQSYC